jgi:hypothetical protein
MQIKMETGDMLLGRLTLDQFGGSFQGEDGGVRGAGKCIRELILDAGRLAREN